MSRFVLLLFIAGSIVAKGDANLVPRKLTPQVWELVTELVCVALDVQNTSKLTQESWVLDKALEKTHFQFPDNWKKQDPVAGMTVVYKKFEIQVSTLGLPEPVKHITELKESIAFKEKISATIKPIWEEFVQGQPEMAVSAKIYVKSNDLSHIERIVLYLFKAVESTTLERAKDICHRTRVQLGKLVRTVTGTTIQEPIDSQELAINEDKPHSATFIIESDDNKNGTTSQADQEILLRTLTEVLSHGKSNS